jgi:hypothetical protein
MLFLLECAIKLGNGMLKNLFLSILSLTVVVIAQAQFYANSNATISATIIHPVGTAGSVSAAGYRERIPDLLGSGNNGELFIHGKSRLLLKDVSDPGVIQILANGNEYDVTVNFRPPLEDIRGGIRIESVDPVPISRNKFYLSTKISIDPEGYMLLHPLQIPCDIFIHFN